MIRKSIFLLCKTPELIENYELATADENIQWDCHHRLETHNSDGEKRLVQLSAAELKSLGMYYNRPANEFIYLKHSEHTALHSSFRKGNNGGGRPKGSHLSEETKSKISNALKGKSFHTEESKAKISKAVSERMKGKESIFKGKSRPWKGKHWKLVEGKRVWY